MSLFIVGLGPGGPEHRTAAAERAVREADVVDRLRPVHRPVRRPAARPGGPARPHGRGARARARGCRAGALVSRCPGLVRRRGRARHGRADARAGLRHRGHRDPGRDRRARDGRASGRAARRRLGDALALRPAPAVGDRRAPPDRRWPMAGIALALYNPRSKTRTEPFDRALAILREHRPGDTPVVVATDVAREGETLEHTTLATVDPATVTMRSLVLVAGETAHDVNGWLVALRDTAAAVAAAAVAARRLAARRLAGGHRPSFAGGGRVTVHLVGAGPGDPALLTVAAADLIRRARVLVYDRPSMDAIVALAPAEAERHCRRSRARAARAHPARGQRAARRPRPRARRGRAAQERRPVRRLARRRGGRRAPGRGHRRRRHPRRVRRARRARRGRHPAHAAPELGHRDLRRRQRRRRARRAARLARARRARRDARDPHRSWAHPPDRGQADRRRPRAGHADRRDQRREPPSSSASCAARSPTCPRRCLPPVTFVVGAAAALELTCTSPKAS